MDALKKAADVSQLGDSWEVEVFPREKSPFDQFVRALGDMSLVKALLGGDQTLAEVLPFLKRLKGWQKMGEVLALNPNMMTID